MRFPPDGARPDAGLIPAFAAFPNLAAAIFPRLRLGRVLGAIEIQLRNIDGFARMRSAWARPGRRSDAACDAVASVARSSTKYRECSSRKYRIRAIAGPAVKADIGPCEIYPHSIHGEQAGMQTSKHRAELWSGLNKSQ